jgi:hypothetical protein
MLPLYMVTLTEELSQSIPFSSAFTSEQVSLTSQSVNSVAHYGEGC